MNWRDISYLKLGNHRQRQAYTALHSLGLFEALAEYDPILAGTIPLGVDIISSDLDVLCQADDLPEMATHLRKLFDGHTHFQVETKTIRGLATLIASFEHAGFRIEIFGQATPVEQQNGYRHMLVEHRLLEMGGEAMREAIRLLKNAGLPTEPAFARLLSLPGDPYQAVLDLEPLDDRVLRQLIS